MYARDGSGWVHVPPLSAEDVAALEVVATAEDANAGVLRVAARAALAGNRAFLALGAPSQAQALAQVVALTRQVQALIRLTVADLDGVD